MYSMFLPAIGFAFLDTYDDPIDWRMSGVSWLALFLIWARGNVFAW